jgi:polar amino acid transport system permease protein
MDLTKEPGPESPTSSGTRPADIKAIPVRHPGRWVAVAVLVVLAAMLVHSMVFSRVARGFKEVNGVQVLKDGHPVPILETRYGWGVVGDYLFSRLVFEGVYVTLELTLIAMVVGAIGGVLLAVMRLSANPILSGVSWIYIWFFRGTPVLVQLYFWVFISYLFPHLTLGVPFGPAILHLDPNTLVTAFLAASVGLGLNEAAYTAEIVRAGILSVDFGQSEAAQSLGMSKVLIMRRIVLPQAMRVIIPPMGNETISMLKTTSLASAIGVTELLRTVNNIYARTYQTVPMLIVACIWYVAITSVLTFGQYYVERYFARGSSRRLPDTPMQKLRTTLTTFRTRTPVTR